MINHNSLNFQLPQFYLYPFPHTQTRLADFDYAAARHALVEFISDEVPDADRRFPEVSELLKQDRRLACLLMLADAGVAMMRSAGVAGPEQTLRYAVRDDGLLARPKPIRESLELANRRNPRDAEVLADRASASADSAAKALKEADQAALVANVDAVVERYAAQLQQSREEMAVIAEAVRRAEAEGLQRAAQEKEVAGQQKAATAARFKASSDKWAASGSAAASSKNKAAASAKGAMANAGSSKKALGKGPGTGTASGKGGPGGRGESRSPSPGRKK